MTSNNKVQLLEERRTLLRANEAAEQQIEDLPEAVRSSLEMIIRTGIESNNDKIARIDDELRRLALLEEQERCKSVNNKVLNLVNTHILGALTSDELGTLANCSGIAIRFSKDKATGQVSVTSSVGSAGRVPRGSSVDKPGEPREKKPRRAIYDTVIRRKFSTWAGVLSAYGLSANGSSGLKVVAALFKDFATRFVDDKGINFVEEVMDKTVPYTIGTAEDAYDEGYVPEQVMNGTPVHPDDIPSYRDSSHDTSTEESTGEDESDDEPEGESEDEVDDETAESESETQEAQTDKPSARQRRPR